MKTWFPPTEAQTLFIDGPVAVYLHKAPAPEILEAFARLERLVKIAALHLEPPREPHNHS